jgi:hypothetical protein
MGQFKPMVKMMTTEPKVELKLKKGGHVAKKAYGGVMPVPVSTMGKLAARGGMMDGAAPMKPSMMARRKAMAAPLLMSKKGGKAGDMAQDKAMIKKAFMQHDMQEHKGGKGTHLKLKHGGKVHHLSGCAEGSLEHHKFMAKHHAKMHKEGGSHHHKKMAEKHKAMCMGGKYAEGGAIDKFETKTTIEGNAGKYAKTKMDTAKKDSAHGTGVVKMGKPAGYKTGGSIPSDTDMRMNKGKSKFGGTIEGNERDFENTEMHTAKRDKAHGTGGIKETNAGGFKRGGSINWENRPADGTPPGITNGKTGGVREANAGGFKKGGAAKKHFATGGSVNDTGRAVAMPKKPVSAPIKNTMQSGTFKKGGKVVHKAYGGSMDDQQMPMRDMSGGAYDRSIGPSEDEMSMANNIRNAPGNMMEAMMKLLGKKPGAGAGRGMVNPPMARKGGGSAKR